MKTTNKKLCTVLRTQRGIVTHYSNESKGIVTAVLEDQHGNKFVGQARTAPGDVFDETVGMKIAAIRAQSRQNTDAINYACERKAVVLKHLKEIDNFIASCRKDNQKNHNKISKVLANHAEKIAAEQEVK